MASSTSIAVPCVHKPEIGCVLTAIPSCCACADKRPMATAYPVYIDGAGMKNTGRRWQKYCWKCRDPLSEEVELHDSSTMSNNPPPPPGFNPSPFYVVDPRRWTSHTNNRGHDRGISPSARADNTGHGNSTYVGGPSPGTQMPPMPTNERPAQSFHHQNEIQTSFNRLNLRSQGAGEESSAQAGSSRPQQLFPLGTREEVQAEDYQSPIASMFGTWYQRYSNAEETRRAARTMNPTALEFEPPASQLDSFRIAPTPIINRFAQPNFHNQFYGSNAGTNNVRAETNSTHQIRSGVQEYPTPFFRGPAGSEGDLGTSVAPSESSRFLYGHMQNSSYAPNPFARPPAPAPLTPPSFIPSNISDTQYQHYLRHIVDERSDENGDDEGPNAIDRQKRPKPLSPEEMIVDISCKICCEQRMDTLTEPCLHLAMCRWCAHVWREEYRQRRQHGDRTYKWRCPLCRKVISGTRRIHLA